MVKLHMKEYPVPTNGIYGKQKNSLPLRMRYMHPAAVDALLALEKTYPGVFKFSDMYRSHNTSRKIKAEKNRGIGPVRSAHNWGLAFDLDVDGTIIRLNKHPMYRGNNQKATYQDVLRLLANKGFYCHRRDGKRGSEDWHFNYLGQPCTALPCLQQAKGGWSKVVESRILDLYGHFDFMPTDVLQDYLKKLGYYSGDVDGKYGKLTRKAVDAFKKDWFLKEANHVPRLLNLIFAEWDYGLHN